MGEQQESDKKKNEGGEKKSENVVTTVVLKVDMHCEGCAKKIKRSLKYFDGVESVKADCGSNKLTVMGKVDPSKVKERVEEKIKKKVELISPQPKKPSKEGGGATTGGGGGGGGGGGDKKAEEKKSESKSDGKEEKKEKPKEPQMSTVLLKTRVHCEGCAQKIRRIVGKYEGVQDVNVDLQKDTITTKGTMNTKELVPYLNSKLRRTVELVQPKKDEGAGGDKKKAKEGGGGAPEKPKEGGGGGSEKKPKEGGGDRKEGDGENKKEGGGEKNAAGGGGENTARIEVSKMEYNGYPYGPGYGFGYNYIYDPRQHGEAGYNHQVSPYWHEPSHPPQMFSDENPNACSVM